jgi:hypothetical protein
MFCFEGSCSVEMIPYLFEIFRNAFRIMDKCGAERLYLLLQLATTLGIKNRVSESLGITTELKNTSHVVSLFNRSCHSWHVVEIVLCSL